MKNAWKWSVKKDSSGSFFMGTLGRIGGRKFGIDSNFQPNAATGVGDLKAAPGWRLHALKGESKPHYTLTVSGNWRLTFCFVGEDVELLDYVDYH